jgi:hypothetical protein
MYAAHWHSLMHAGLNTSSMLHDGTHLGTTAMHATYTLHLQQAQLTAPFNLLSILSHLSINR